MLKKLDRKRAKTIDKNNRVRLVRAIEIVRSTGKPVPSVILSGAKDLNPGTDSSTASQNDILIIGLTKPPLELRRVINKRLDKRLKQGMVAEVKKLRKQGVSFKRLENFGLEYRYISWYLQGKLTYPQMVDQLKKAIWQFSRRQMTWFRKDKRIKWVDNQDQAERLIRKFVQIRTS